MGCRKYKSYLCYFYFYFIYAFYRVPFLYVTCMTWITENPFDG